MNIVDTELQMIISLKKVNQLKKILKKKPKKNYNKKLEIIKKYQNKKMRKIYLKKILNIKKMIKKNKKNFKMK